MDEMLRRFRLEEPESVAEVSELLGRFGESEKVYAGGTELLLAMKEGLVEYERLINVKKLTGLSDVTIADGALVIGALCTAKQLENSPVLKDKLPALTKLEQNVVNVRVRKVGTIGGNLCFAERHADPGTLLIALGAKMTAEKSSSKREIAAEDFFVDAYETALQADEVLTKIHIPVPVPNARSAYLKFGYLERPSVGVAVAFNLNGGGSGGKNAAGRPGPAPRRGGEGEARPPRKRKDPTTRPRPEAGGGGRTGSGGRDARCAAP